MAAGHVEMYLLVKQGAQAVLGADSPDHAVPC